MPSLKSEKVFPGLCCSLCNDLPSTLEGLGPETLETISLPLLFMCLTNVTNVLVISYLFSWVCIMPSMDCTTYMLKLYSNLDLSYCVMVERSVISIIWV